MDLAKEKMGEAGVTAFPQGGGGGGAEEGLQEGLQAGKGGGGGGTALLLERYLVVTRVSIP